MHTLNLNFGAGVPSWERSLFGSLLNALGRDFRVRIVEKPQISSLDPKKDLLWCVTSYWERAAHTLPYHFKGQVFLSPLSAEADAAYSPFEQLVTLFVLQKLRRKWSKRLHILSHSPFAQRFFLELHGLEDRRLHSLPLPVVESASRPPGRSIASIGVVDAFEASTDLPFVLSVLHYVHQKEPGVRFLFSGKGRLESHLRNSAEVLGFGPQLEMVAMDKFDPSILLYAPLRNTHFAPVLFAASNGIPVVSTDVVGIEAFVEDGITGLIASSEQVRAAGEFSLRLIADEVFRKQVGQKFSRSTRDRFSLSATVEMLKSVFYPGPSASAENKPSRSRSAA